MYLSIVILHCTYQLAELDDRRTNTNWSFLMLELNSICTEPGLDSICTNPSWCPNLAAAEQEEQLFDSKTGHGSNERVAAGESLQKELDKKKPWRIRR